MIKLALSRSKHLIPFAAVLNQAGQRVDRLLTQARLPGDCFDDPETVIPGEAVFRFRELAGRTLGQATIALDATRDLQFSDLGEFGRALLRAPTLYRLLTTFRDHLNTQTTITELEIERLESGDLTFCYRFSHVPSEGIWHSDLYTLQWAIKIIRLVSPSWKPSHIWTVSSISPERQGIFERICDGAVKFGRDCTGFLIPSAMLAQPLASQAEGIGNVDKQQLGKAALPQNDTDVMQRVIRTYANDRWLTISEASDVLGSSVRTIQRRLATHQATYRGVLEHTRAEMASELLVTSDGTIGEIGEQLGYANQGNFTRAFRRWAGVSPREYRLQQRPA